MEGVLEPAPEEAVEGVEVVAIGHGEGAVGLGGVELGRRGEGLLFKGVNANAGMDGEVGEIVRHHGDLAVLTGEVHAAALAQADAFAVPPEPAPDAQRRELREQSGEEIAFGETVRAGEAA